MCEELQILEVLTCQQRTLLITAILQLTTEGVFPKEIVGVSCCAATENMPVCEPNTLWERFFLH